MEKSKTSLVKRADGAVKTVESWWSFGSAIWEARGFFTPVTVLGGLMTTAILEIFTFFSELGWAGWVLAGVPMFVLSSLIIFGLSWLWHLRPSARAVSGGRAVNSMDKALDNFQSATNALQYNEAEILEIEKNKQFRKATIRLMRLQGLLKRSEATLNNFNKNVETVYNTMKEGTFTEAPPSDVRSEATRLNDTFNFNVRDPGGNAIAVWNDFQSEAKGLVDLNCDFSSTPMVDDNPHRVNPPYIERLPTDAMKHEYKKIYERIEGAKRISSKIPDLIRREIETEEVKILSIDD